MVSGFSSFFYFILSCLVSCGLMELGIELKLSYWHCRVLAFLEREEREREKKYVNKLRNLSESGWVLVVELVCV